MILIDDNMNLMSAPQKFRDRHVIGKEWVFSIFNFWRDVTSRETHVR